MISVGRASHTCVTESIAGVAKKLDCAAETLYVSTILADSIGHKATLDCLYLRINFVVAAIPCSTIWFLLNPDGKGAETLIVVEVAMQLILYVI